MKKYKRALDVLLLAGLILVALLAVAPNTFVMPTAAQMVLVAVIFGLISVFLVFIWREKPQDEREAKNQADASRLAYIVGASCLILALIVQSINHSIDSAVPIALLAMITTKLVAQAMKNK